MERYYTPEQIAELLVVQRKTVREWLRTGELHGIRLGGRNWRVPESSLQAYLRQKMQSDEAEAARSATQIRALLPEERRIIVSDHLSAALMLHEKHPEILIETFGEGKSSRKQLSRSITRGDIWRITVSSGQEKKQSDSRAAVVIGSSFPGEFPIYPVVPVIEAYPFLRRSFHFIPLAPVSASGLTSPGVADILQMHGIPRHNLLEYIGAVQTHELQTILDAVALYLEIPG